MHNPSQKKTNVKKLVLIAMLAAVAFIVTFLGIHPLPAADFLKYEPKDVIITTGGFILGPLASFAMSFIVSLLEMLTNSTTGPIGALMNLLSSCSFAFVASVIYKRRHTLLGAVEGLLTGSVIMVATMILWNWLITPLYQGVPRSAIEPMLVPVFLPFNLLKAGLNSAFILLLYKPLVTALRKAHLVDAPKAPSAQKQIPWGIYILALFLLVTCILLVLVFQGKL